MVYTITTQGRMFNVSQFEDIIVRAEADGSTVRLRDLARVELGSKDDDFVGRINGRSATLIGVFLGASYQEKRSSGASGLALALGALMVFLILSAQYEKWSLPLSVMFALPFGTFGALAAVWLRGMTNDVYFQIGLVTLLGLAAKNAILIVEYASLKHHEGLSPSAAALEAARLRFRPIIMTSLAFILGVLPLAFSSGAGAGARVSVGTGVMGGMLAATFLAIFLVPMFYKVLTERRLRERRSTAEIVAEGQETA